MQTHTTEQQIYAAEITLADRGWLVAESAEEGDLVTGYEEGAGEQWMDYNGGWVAHVTDTDNDLNFMVSFENRGTGLIQQAMRIRAENIPGYWEL